MADLKPILIAAAALLAGCGDPPGEGDGNAVGNAVPAEGAQPVAEAQRPERVVKSETVEAVFEGWEMGDYLWAKLAIPGRATEGAFVGPTPIEHFLEAHKGKPVVVRIDTVTMEIPEAGGAEDVQTISDAAAGGVSAARWWAGLSAEQRAAAERRMEEVLGGG